jgi:hypothetical protein
MPSTAVEYAATLYDKLHQADAHGRDWIAVDLPPRRPTGKPSTTGLRAAALHSEESPLVDEEFWFWVAQRFTAAISRHF